MTPAPPAPRLSSSAVSAPPRPSRPSARAFPGAAATSRSEASRNVLASPPPRPSSPPPRTYILAKTRRRRRSRRSSRRQSARSQPRTPARTAIRASRIGPRCGGECASAAGPNRSPSRSAPALSGEEGRGPARPGWFSPARDGSGWPPPPSLRPGGGRRVAVRLQPPAALRCGDRGNAGFRPRHAGAACCPARKRCGAEAGSAGRGLARRGCCGRGLSTAALRGGAALARLAVQPPALALSASALPHMEPRLRRSPRLRLASRAQAGSGSPQEGVGTG